MENNQKRGFTLIELLVVMALIGVLASIVIVSLKGAIEKARMVKVLKFSQGIQNALGADIVLNLSFDDQANPTKDASGYGNDGIVNVTAPGGFTDDTPHKVLGAGPAQGKWALSFDGDDYVDCGNNPSLNITDAITIEAWVRPINWAGPTANGIVTRRSAVDKGYFFFYLIATNSINVDFGGSSQRWNTGYNPPLNTWSHLVYTFDSGNKGKFYVNGALYNTTTKGGGVSDNVSLMIARDSSASQYYFNGTIDEIRIYNQALTAMEIQKHYAEGLEKYKNFAIK